MLVKKDSVRPTQATHKFVAASEYHVSLYNVFKLGTLETWSAKQIHMIRTMKSCVQWYIASDKSKKPFSIAACRRSGVFNSSTVLRSS